ncbi:MAG: FecR domain-containing protein [Gammaproteobacteria bacterium]|nr:FecR domain-containing protein [Gammaproteobacteria bacterium]
MTSSTPTGMFCRKLHRFHRFAGAAALLLGTQTALYADDGVLHYPLRQGDNPWNITQRFLHGMEYWKPLLKLNGIDRPRHLKPGTTLTIPLQWLRVEPGGARVQAVSGEADLLSDGQTRPLRLDSELVAGDQVIIGENGSAVLEYSDGSTLLLAKDTRLTLTRADRFPGMGLADTRIRLDAGRTENRVKPRGSRFEIDTPSASTAVRGTQFRASVDSQAPQISRVEVTRGEVAVSAAGTARGISAGFGTLVEKGKPPLPPVRLLPATRFIEPVPYSRRFPLEIRWQATNGASGYRLLANALDSKVPLLDQVTARTSLSTDALPDGSYRLTLRAIDANGLEGEESSLQFELDAQPQPPLALLPEIDQRVRSELPTFEWTRPGNGASARLQLFSQGDPTTPLLDVAQLEDARFTPDQLAPGDYSWRLQAELNGEQGPWGVARTFTLRPAPAAPEIASSGDERSIRLQWPDSGEGRHYRVQLADSAKFDQLISEATLETPTWQTERPPMLSFFRVRVIDSDGYEGAWSVPQMIDPAPTPWYIYMAPLAFLLLAL